MNLSNHIKSIFKSDFLRNTMVLMGGSGLAQALPILVSPVLTRLYSPESFGLLSVFTACSTILVVFACGRYDLAIIVPKSSKDANILVLICTKISMYFTLLLFLIVILLHDSIIALLNEPRLDLWLYFLPVAVYSLTYISIYTNWLNRKKAYKKMSAYRVILSTVVTTTSLVIGLIWRNIEGLVLGYLIGQLFIALLIKFNDEVPFYKASVRSQRYLLKKYIRFPKYLITSTFFAELSLSVPIFLFTTFFSNAITGFFTLCYRVTTLPALMIGNAIGEVYRQKAAEYYANNGNCKILFEETFKKLILLALIPFFLLVLFGESLFVFVFGAQWEISGEMSVYMSFLVFFQLISVPLSYTITFNDSQKIDLILQVFRVTFSFLGIFVGYFFFDDFMIAIKIYVAVFSIYYILHSLVQYRAAKGGTNRIFSWNERS